MAGDSQIMDRVRPDKLASCSDDVPARFEYGTSPFAQHAGLVAAVDHLAGLAAPDPALPRRDRMLTSLAAVADHETTLLRRLLEGLAAMPHVERIGAPARQAPTVRFRVRGRTPDDVARNCAAADVNVWSGHNYAWELPRSG